MTRRDPNLEGESPATFLGAGIALFAGLMLLVVLALIADLLVPGGLRDAGPGDGCCVGVSEP